MVNYDKVIHQVYHQGDMLTVSNVNGKFILQEFCKGRGSLIYAKKNKHQRVTGNCQ